MRDRQTYKQTERHTHHDTSHLSQGGGGEEINLVDWLINLKAAGVTQDVERHVGQVHGVVAIGNRQPAGYHVRVADRLYLQTTRTSLS